MEVRCRVRKRQKEREIEKCVREKKRGRETERETKRNLRRKIGKMRVISDIVRMKGTKKECSNEGYKERMFQ